jgi:hypothetical protein
MAVQTTDGQTLEGRVLNEGMAEGGVKWLASPKSKRGPDITWEQLVKALEGVRSS